LRPGVDAWRLIATDSEMHMTEEPESANRWATEHYGFDDHAARPEGRVNDATALPARPTPTQRGARRPRPRTALIASAVVSVALVAGIGGTAVASDDGPGGGREGIVHVDHGGHHGGQGGIR
ncbi:MAG TPA: hypothetical protein VM684_07840, partial [Gaiellales bacterium]|nr:hypothetical protein [Gaiellales bacterium]